MGHISGLRDGRCLRPALFLLGTVAAFDCPGPAWAETGIVERAAAGGPIVLSDAKLDALTASGITATFSLLATATGPNVSTATEGSVRTARTTVLRIDVEPAADPLAEGAVRARLVDEIPADLLFAHGSATASGSSNAQCTATLSTPSTFAYFQQMTARSITPTLATCACAAFGISITP